MSWTENTSQQLGRLAHSCLQIAAMELEDKQSGAHGEPCHVGQHRIQQCHIPRRQLYIPGELLYRQGPRHLTAEVDIISTRQGNMSLRSMHCEGRSPKLHKPDVRQASGFEVRVKRLLPMRL